MTVSLDCSSKPDNNVILGSLADSEGLELDGGSLVTGHRPVIGHQS